MSTQVDHVICISNGQTVFRNFKYAICVFIVIDTVPTVQVPIYDFEYSTVDVHCLLYYLNMFVLIFNMIKHNLLYLFSAKMLFLF